MTDSSIKNSWIVDLSNYEPVLATADGDVVLEAGFSLAEENTDTGELLKRLANFIRGAERRVEASSRTLTPLLPFSVSQKVVEQIVFLAYWKNYRLKFHIDTASDDFIVWARFPNKPELNCVLDQFTTGFDPCHELQRWLEFFCTISKDLAEIWQIHMVVDGSVYETLAVRDHTSIFIEVQNSECTLINYCLPALLSPSG